jgi:ankyrin repeat protein
MATDVNEKLPDGSTYLHRAAERGDVVEGMRLLDRGAGIEARDGWGRTALIVASQVGDEEIVRLLVDRGANLDVQNHNGMTALMEAALSGRVEVMRLLLDADADVSLRNRSGATVRDFVQDKGNAAMEELLRARTGGQKKSDHRRLA